MVRYKVLASFVAATCRQPFERKKNPLKSRLNILNNNVVINISDLSQTKSLDFPKPRDYLSLNRKALDSMYKRMISLR